VLRDATIMRGGELAEAALLHPTLLMRPGSVRYGTPLVDEEEDEEAGTAIQGTLTFPVPVKV
jgi:hypothetical protein